MGLSSGAWELIVTACASGAVGCFAYVVFATLARAREAAAAAKREVIVTETSSLILRAFLPLARSLGRGQRALLGGARVGVYELFRDSVARRLHAAGSPQGLDADEYVGFAMIWAFFAGAFGVFQHILFEMDVYMTLYSAFGLWAGLALLWWRSWLHQRQELRQRAIRKTLPFCLDLLTLAMEAGLDFTAALGRMVKKLGKNPLGQEFSLLLHEIQLGKTRSDALRDFASRVAVAEVRSVVASLIQAEELGASLGPILRIQAAQQRERRSLRAEEMAMKAPVKMLFPLTVFIFPTTLIMIFVPIFLHATR